MVTSKKKVVIVGFYLPGVYPSGDESVISDLLAPAFLKTSAETDEEIRAQFSIKILNLPTTLNTREVARRICDENPYIVAYSVYMWNYDQMVESSRIVKELLPETTIVLGGPQVTYNSEDMLDINPQVDIIVCGSGESRFRSLLKTDLSKDALSQIPKVTYRDENRRPVHTQGSFSEDLTMIPSPFQTKVIDLDDGERHTVYLETFRGCPFECGYCIWGDPEKSLHKFPLEQLLKDIEIIYNHPKVETVYLTDACLFYTRERAKIICEKIASCSRKIPTVATLDILVLNEGMIEDLKKLSVIRNQFHFGLQTTNSLALELLKRKSGPNIFTKKIGQLRSSIPGAEISFDLIYGLPGDTYEGFRKSVDFALSLKPGKLYLSPLLLLPGTPFWDEKVEFGFDYENKPPYMVRSNNHFSKEDMKKTVRFVLWVLAIMYYPAIRDLICKIPEVNPKFDRIELIDRFVEIVQKQVDPVSDISYEFTIDWNNSIRRNVMSEFCLPQNSLYFYKAALELLKSCGAEKLSEDIFVGIDYYRTICKGVSEADPAILQKFDAEKINHIKTKWVTA
jgi:radical SAM superfamily enzyme YgiQ (UPF0313 family)